MKIQITLSAANLGPNATEEDFDRWAAYVAEHVETALSLPEGTTEVDQARFSEGGDDVVIVRGSAADGGDRDEATIEEDIGRWLGNEGWEAFCGEEAA